MRSFAWGDQLEERRLLDELSDSDSEPRRVLPLEPVLPAAVEAPVEADPAEEPYPLVPMPEDELPDCPDWSSPVNMLFSFSRQDWNSLPNFCCRSDRQRR